MDELVKSVLEEVSKDLQVEQAVAFLLKMPEDKRLEVFAEFCGFCGVLQPSEGPGCQCWNDE